MDANIELDGSAVTGFVEIGETGFGMTRVAVSPGAHHIVSPEAPDIVPDAFGVMVEGLDWTTLTPVDGRAFNTGLRKDTLFGFSGNVGSMSGRGEVVKSLEWFGGLKVLQRNDTRNYLDHARFVSRCRILLNVSKTGSGQTDHIKGRVLEAAAA